MKERRIADSLPLPPLLILHLSVSCWFNRITWPPCWGSACDWWAALANWTVCTGEDSAVPRPVMPVYAEVPEANSFIIMRSE